MGSTPDQSEPASRSPAQWRTDIRDAMSRGELLPAYDLAYRARVDCPMIRNWPGPARERLLGEAAAR